MGKPVILGQPVVYERKAPVSQIPSATGLDPNRLKAVGDSIRSNPGGEPSDLQRNYSFNDFMSPTALPPLPQGIVKLTSILDDKGIANLKPKVIFNPVGTATSIQDTIGGALKPSGDPPILISSPKPPVFVPWSQR